MGLCPDLVSRYRNISTSPTSASHPDWTAWWGEGGMLGSWHGGSGYQQFPRILFAVQPPQTTPIHHHPLASLPRLPAHIHHRPSLPTPSPLRSWTALPTHPRRSPQRLHQCPPTPPPRRGRHSDELLDFSDTCSGEKALLALLSSGERLVSRIGEWRGFEEAQWRRCVDGRVAEGKYLSEGTVAFVRTPFIALACYQTFSGSSCSHSVKHHAMSPASSLRRTCTRNIIITLLWT
jgi:hypothetical protein